MPVGNWSLEWLNHNSQRAYPLVDWATARDLGDTITIPQDFLVAMRFPIHAGLDVSPERFLIRRLIIHPSGYNIGLGYDDGTTITLAATANVTASTHTENKSYRLVGLEDFDDCEGRVVVGSLDAVAALPPGVYVFDRDGAAIEVDAITPMIRGISSLIAVNGTERSERCYGDVEIVAGPNQRLVVSDASGPTPRITISAISGEGLNEACGCDNVDDPAGEAIRFINGIPPLPDGNYRMVGDDCVALEPIANGLRITNPCATPCCGCDKLQAVLDQGQRLGDGAATVRAFATRLESMVTQMSLLVLGSTLGDGQGCVEC